MMTPHEALLKAIQVLGSQTALAAAVGPDIKTAHIYNWLNKSAEVPSKYAPSIERATRDKGDPVLCEWLSPSTDWSIVTERPDGQTAATAEQPAG
jgi:DNA-binding transcriptional regulator YdaS (Cro superfamily)